MPGQRKAVPMVGVGQIWIQLQSALELPFRFRPLPHIPMGAGQGQMSLPYQIELLGTELANSKHLWPSQGEVDPEIAALIGECVRYAPAEHCGDRLAALCFALWGVRQGEIKVEFFDSHKLAYRGS